MSLSNGRELLAMPGPTNVPDAVLQAMHRPAIDIYAGELIGMTDSCLTDLRRVFATAHRTYVYASNGHGAWEAALTNVLSRDDRVLVLESGLFAGAWGMMAKTLGVEVEVLAGDLRRAVDPEQVQSRLRQDDKGRIAAVLVVQVDTASGVVNDIEAIRRAMDAAGHGALLMVDAIASLATMPFKMDAWGVDVAVCGSQKGLMLPPGLGFVAAGERALRAHKRADLRTHYWDWTFREGQEHYQKYCGTPPEQLVFGLRKSLDMLFAEGLENVFERHRLLAETTRRAVATWSDAGCLEFNICEPLERSNSVTTLLMTGGQSPGPIADFCRETCGVILGAGIGPFKDRALRIAHMGHVNAPMLLGTLASVELALTALELPHGPGGVDAALRWLGATLRTGKQTETAFTY